MEKLVIRWIKILAAGIFYPVILVGALILAAGLIIGIWASEMRFWFKPLMVLLIGAYAVIVFAAVWEETRKTIGQNFGR